MRSISIFPAYGRRWRTKADVFDSLLKGQDVRTPAGYATLTDLISRGYELLEARSSEQVLITAFSPNTNEMRKYLEKSGRPTGHAPRPLTTTKVTPTETEARQACQAARNGRAKLDKLSSTIARLQRRMTEVRKVVTDNETIVHAWETSLTDVQRRKPKEDRVESAARRREREMENKLREALGLPALAEGEKGLL